jgi:hypothetical protein
MTTRPTHRQVKAALTAEIAPFLARLGFEPNAKSHAARPVDGPFEYTFTRFRGPYVDEVQFNFEDWLPPCFGVNFWTDQTERMLHPDPRKLTPWERVWRRWHCPLLTAPPRKHPWYRFKRFPIPPPAFGKAKSLPDTMDLVKLRLAELDHHLKVGAATRCMVLAGDVVVKRGDPSNARPIPPPPLADQP